MLKIGVVSQKGGVGKSTIARDLARCYAFAGWRVKIADLDYKQKTSADWSAQRMQVGLEPVVPVEVFPDVKHALTTSGVQVLIIDGKPHSDKETLDIAKACDLVVIPTGTTLDDLRPQIKLAHTLVAGRVESRNIIFVINSAGSLGHGERARNFIRDSGYTVADAIIMRRDTYATAQNNGLSISEVGYDPLRETAEHVASQLMNHFVKGDASVVR